MRTRHKIGALLLASTALIAPAAAQQGQPNPNQAAGKAILQAADKAKTDGKDAPKKPDEPEPPASA